MLARIVAEMLDRALMGVAQPGETLVGGRAVEGAARVAQGEHEEMHLTPAEPKRHLGLGPIDLALLTWGCLEAGPCELCAGL